MPNLTDATQEFLKNMGSAVYHVNTTVPAGSALVQTITNPEQIRYESKFSGGIYAKIVNFTDNFMLVKRSIGRLEGSRFIAIEAEKTTGTNFRFNYILGTNGAPGAPDITEDSYTDTRVWPVGSIYKFTWYINRNGTGDAFWVNNAKHGITNLPNRVETFDLDTVEVLCSNTPAEYKLGMLFTTLDVNVDDVQMTNLFGAYQNKAPVYLGAGAKMLSGNYRCSYIHNANTLIRNNATDMDFEQKNPALPVDYSHVVERIRIP